MKRKKIIIFFVLILLFLLSISGCLPWQKKKEPPKVNLLSVESEIVSILNLPLYVAIEEGFFKEQGLKLSLEYVKTNGEALDALKSGSVDAALLGTDQIILEKKNQANTDLTLFAHTFQGLGAYLLAREPMPSFQWSEMKGSSIIGHHYDSISEMTLEETLRRNELIPQEGVVIFRNLPYDLTLGAFKSGSGTYLFAFQPRASELVEEGNAHIVTSFGPKAVGFPVQSYISKKSFLDTHPVASQQFVNGLYKAQLWIEKYPSEKIAKSVKSHYEGLDEEVLIKIVDRYKAEGIWKPEIIVPQEETLNSLQEVMIAGAAIHEKLPCSDLVYPKYANKAVEKVILPDEKEKTRWEKFKDFFKN